MAEEREMADGKDIAEITVDADLVRRVIKKRNADIHKGDCGRVLIEAGSAGMAGAAVLAARGALRSGSGLVQVCVPEDVLPVVQSCVIEATCLIRGFTPVDLSRYNAAAAGPGLGTGPESARVVKDLVTGFRGPLVLDADALNLVAKEHMHGLLARRPAGMTVITPHTGEALRLLGAESFAGDRRQLAEELRRITGAIVVLKGHATLTAAGDDRIYINTTGNPGMATAGSGDVLTGMITGLAGQKKPDGSRLTAEEAAVCGVFLHGLAGDLAAGETGEYGLTAQDIAYHAALAIKKILN